MVASREPRMIAGFRYDEIIESIDWNRILIQASGLHHQKIKELAPNHKIMNPLCGSCIKEILLRIDDIVEVPPLTLHHDNETIVKKIEEPPLLGLSKEKIYATISNLEQAYPNGWRSGNPTIDGITIVLANGLREMTEALLKNRR